MHKTTLLQRLKVIPTTGNYSTQLLNFVPKHDPVLESDIQQLRSFVHNSRKITVLTGAGISTESGIPDYRSEEVGLYARTNHKPIQHLEFVKSADVRRRYWARNYVGWGRFSSCQPNSVHYAVRDLELELDKVSNVVTQNVDNLHFKAGSRKVIELHGTGFRVVCLRCGISFTRCYIQEKLAELNPHMTETVDMVRPDGDVEISQDVIKGFTPPSCDSCRGPLKPDITFFGDNVPIARVDAVRSSVSASDSLLVLGSSLSVFSGYRIVLQALEERKDVCVVNIGPTRADKLVRFKIAARCGDILPRVC